MGVTAYLLSILLIGMMLIMLTTWVFLAKSGIPEHDSVNGLGSALFSNPILRIIGRILPLLSAAFTLFIITAFLNSVISRSHSDVWVQNQKRIYYSLFIEVILAILANVALARIYSDAKLIRRAYWTCALLSAAILLIHVFIITVYESIYQP